MTETTEEKQPVRISGEATRSLASKMRQWSGWPKARLLWDVPAVSPYGETEHVTRTFTINPEPLVLNPNRVLLTVTPFRLRQEAVLTGVMLHEASHARHTHWKPRTLEDLESFSHSDGSKVAASTFALASLMEEPRIEGRVAEEADQIGAFGLAWTMRAMAAHLLPTTRLNLDPNQGLMDLIESWALRAGRQIGLNEWTGRALPNWVNDFNSLLHTSLVAHFEALADDGALGINPVNDANNIKALLYGMIRCADDEGASMVDMARDVLTRLFPETDPEDQPQAGGGCAQPAPPEDGQSEKGSPQPGEGDESDEQGEGGTSAPGEDDKPGDGDSEGEGKPSEEEGEGKGGASTSTEESDKGDEEGEGQGQPTPAQQTMQEALAAMEAQSKAADEKESKDESESQPTPTPTQSAGSGRGSAGQGGFRTPNKAERQVQKNAERFLRNLIDGSEASKISLSETPSANIDPAAHAAWKAGGQVRDPQFFIRTRREVQPTPPVKIAVLVDISQSMSILQKPSALLSWALSSAALDLRNFAGRGVQIESTLVHWGTVANVVQKNGEMLPGIREVSCDQGTSAMGEALDLVEEQLPGFLDGDGSGTPANRLLVQFTDWELMGGGTLTRTVDRVSRLLASGVNMVTVTPKGFSSRYSSYSTVMQRSRIQRGKASIIQYNPSAPEQVWDHTAEMLSGKTPAPFAGF